MGSPGLDAYIIVPDDTLVMLCCCTSSSHIDFSVARLIYISQHRALQILPRCSRRQGVEWYRHRSVLNKMLLPREVLNYLKPMNEVASDFVTRLTSVRGADGRIEKIEMELFRWAMECE